MGGDMVAALGRATVDGQTLFGHNSTQPPRACQALRLVPGRPFAFGEKVRAGLLELPQARQTYTVLGCQAHGRWGYQHGVNEHGVAAGRAPLTTRLPAADAGLTGPDLVRLALERGRSARQAVDLLTDLVSRHGQAAEPGDGAGNAFLIADAGEAFAVESAGRFWVYQEVREVRAHGGLSTIRQDWDRIAPGLSEHALGQGWWPADGSKIDFAAAVSGTPPEREPARAADFRRWGRATLLLGEQNGHIDAAFVRRLLGDHREGDEDEADPFAAAAGSLCRHPHGGATEATAASLVAALAREPGRLQTVWCAFGPPCLSVYFPLFLEGELPAAFTRSSTGPSADSAWWRLRGVADFLAAYPARRDLAREALGRLQARFDQEAEEFAAEGASLRQRGVQAEVRRQASLFMEHCLERFEEVWAGVARQHPAGVGAGWQ